MKPPQAKVVEAPATAAEAKKKNVLLEGSVILAAASAAIYYIHYLYLYSYYQTFDLALIDLHYSLQDILFFNPWVAMGIFTFAIMIFYCVATEPIEITTKFQWKIACGFLAFLITFVAACFAYLGARDGLNRIESKRYQVIIATEDRTITGYSYLTRNEDCFFFYKARDAGKRPEVFLLRADKVKEITYGESLP
jgi:hypothetical protein